MSVSAQVTSAGVIAPSYAEILAYFVAAYTAIYGADVVLTPNTPDGQLMAIFASAVNDANQTAIAVYNEFSPGTAQGAGLSSVVKINGITREASSQSSAVVSIVGTVGLEINNGQVGDNLNLNTIWNLPALVTIPDAGTIDVTATNAAQGAITAGAATLTVILTPTRGWLSVTNGEAAATGAPVESDATLRQRQTVSTSLPALTVTEAILAAIINLPTVTRATIHENATGSTDTDGVPGHTIDCIVQGGVVQDIINTIGARKTPGTGTFGNTSGTYVDKYGISYLYHYDVLAQVGLTVDVQVRALSGYVSTTTALIELAVANFINALAIGEDSYLNRLYAPADLSGDAAVAAYRTINSGTNYTDSQIQALLDTLSATYQVQSITQSRGGNPAYTTVTGGPYNTGSVTIDVALATAIYAGQQIAFVLDNAASWPVIVTGVSTLAITFFPAVPSARHVSAASDVYLISDVVVAFNEAATCTADDVSVNF